MSGSISPTARCVLHRAVFLFASRRVARWARLACLLLLAALPASVTAQQTSGFRAKDRVTLADGQAIVGLVLAETTQQVLVLVRTLEPSPEAPNAARLEANWPAGTVHWIDRSEIAQVRRQLIASDPAPLSADPAAISIAIIPIGIGQSDQIGRHITAEGVYLALQSVIAQAKSLNIDPATRVVIIFHFVSRGGMLAEVPWLIEIIQWAETQFHATVGLIERAESAAGLVALACDRLMFLPSGVLGAAVAFEEDATGTPHALTGPARDNAVQIARLAAQAGHRNPDIAEAMATQSGLSFDPATSMSTLGDAGPIVINRIGTVLTLSSVEAQRIGVSQATVNDLGHLIRELGTGLPGRLFSASPMDALVRRADAAAFVYEHAEELSDSLKACLALLEATETSPAERSLVLTNAWKEIARLEALIESFPELSRHAAFEPAWLQTWIQKFQAFGHRP